MRGEAVQRRHAQQVIVGLERALQRHCGARPADLSQPLGGGGANVAVLVVERLRERLDGIGVTDLAKDVGGELAHVAVVAAEPLREHGHCRRADPSERFSSGVPCLRVVALAQRGHQVRQRARHRLHLGQPLHGRFPDAPALVAEPLQQLLER